MSVIETRGLTKDYGSGRGLFDLDLRLSGGRVHGFLGPNGAGKTTAIRLLMGFLRPDRGGSRVLGLDPVTQGHLLKRRVGYVPGELAMPSVLTGAEFLAQSAGLRGGVNETWRQALITRLQAEPDVRIGTLSKGNRQKIALIDALQHRPELLIMDEPTDGLDPLLRLEVRRLLRDHARSGGTVFLSSHVVHEIQTVCDDVSIVIDGRLRTRSSIRELIEREGLVVVARVKDPDVAASRLAEHGAEDIRTKGSRVRARVRGDPLPALALLHALGASDLRLRQGDLEETFLRLYGGVTT